MYMYVYMYTCTRQSELVLIIKSVMSRKCDIIV